MEFFTKIPVMEADSLRLFKKTVDSSFRSFSRQYGEGIENFFDPLLYFLVWLEKLLVNSPWPIVLLVFGVLAWIVQEVKLVIGTIIFF